MTTKPGFCPWHGESQTTTEKGPKSLTDLYRMLYDEGVSFYDEHIPDDKPKSAILHVHRLNCWGVVVDMQRLDNTKEEYATMLHECGHYATGTTHAVNSPWDLVERHENRADRWAIENFISANDLDEAVAAGYTELWQLADRFGVTEDLMRKAVCWYTHGNIAADLYF